MCVSAIIYIVGNAGGQGKTTMIVQPLASFCLGPPFIALPVCNGTTMDVLATRQFLNPVNVTDTVRSRAYARTTWIDSVSLTAILLKSAPTALSRFAPGQNNFPQR
jgi:hypothetical protein